ncbi:hypothetical protein [Frondihabitans peucedani]|uniref:DNA helicase n=1 Tax=Frondihabitans peucedani TaxID=598626 RepID=A0ABP8E1H0_9MICO
MATSRKRTREMKKLRGDAADIWGETREVLGHSAQFWKEAGAEAAAVAVNDVAPRVRAALDNQVKPAVSSGVAQATTAATAAAATAKERLVKDVAPAVTAAVASSPLADLANDPKVAEFVKSGKKAGKKLSKKAKKRAIKAAAKQARKHPKAAIKVAKAAKAARSVQKQHSKKNGIGAGGVFLIILGVIGLGALVYAAVQTLRADDELWVADDDDKA